jgi:hypothetical protein
MVSQDELEEAEAGRGTDPNRVSQRVGAESQEQSTCRQVILVRASNIRRVDELTPFYWPLLLLYILQIP